MSTSHYFSSPDGPYTPRDVTVTLEGRSLTVATAGGVFSPDGVDKGTAILLNEVPDPSPTGHLLDVGCGWGPLTLSLAMRAPEATVWAVDVNERARELCRLNAERFGLANVQVMAPEDVPTGVRFDTIWSNPPIRIGKQALHELLQLWLPRLESNAEAWLVVQKNLGADSLLTWIGSMLAAVGEDFSAERADSSKGFRLLRVRRAAAQESAR